MLHCFQVGLALGSERGHLSQMPRSTDHVVNARWLASKNTSASFMPNSSSKLEGTLFDLQEPSGFSEASQLTVGSKKRQRETPVEKFLRRWLFGYYHNKLRRQIEKSQDLPSKHELCVCCKRYRCKNSQSVACAKKYQILGGLRNLPDLSVKPESTLHEVSALAPYKEWTLERSSTEQEPLPRPPCAEELLRLESSSKSPLRPTI